MRSFPMKTVNLKEGMPQVHQALSQLDSELARAQEEGYGLVKLIHGYGSTEPAATFGLRCNEGCAT